MEGSSDGSSYNPPVKPPTELETLQKQHVEKTVKIQELKKQIEELKTKTVAKKGIMDERKEAFNRLSEKYNSLREEYNALLSEGSLEHRLI
ncbi:hypothetical protein V6N13_078983 [Hibiscus sabdariffa]|uniref:Uncharacterized protein n=1 Tax=Hibiscus sabdariffa TaxID=183260 RepID=A0ABR2RQW7_9ROSI